MEWRDYYSSKMRKKKNETKDSFLFVLYIQSIEGRDCIIQAKRERKRMKQEMSPYFALYTFTGATFWECLPSLQCSENRGRDEVDVTEFLPPRNTVRTEILTQRITTVYTGAGVLWWVCAHDTQECAQRRDGCSCWLAGSRGRSL